LGTAENPQAVRISLFRWPAQTRRAGGVIRPEKLSAAADLRDELDLSGLSGAREASGRISPSVAKDH
jgi:hypothetical protein